MSVAFSKLVGSASSIVTCAMAQASCGLRLER